MKVNVKVWLYPGPSPWHFVTIPKKESDKIKTEHGHLERGWRSLPLDVQIGKTKWKTSMFYDSQEEGYILPLKKDVRKKENIEAGDTITLTFHIRD